MGLSSDGATPVGQVAGAPLYGYAREPGAPPVRVARLTADEASAGGWAPSRSHAHDFLVLVYFDRGGGRLQLDGRPVPVGTGDVVVVAPGEVVTPEWQEPEERSTAWAVYFPPDAVESRSPGALRSWRAHPLLFPFVGRRVCGAERLHVPDAERPRWAARFAELDRELCERCEGYAEAALALLTLVLVDLARLASDVPGHLRLRDEPVLAAVFDVVERRFAEPISLRDVADEVGLTPGYLTTVVGRRTGRTVQQWLTERRLAEARRLLNETDATVAAVAGRVGYRDAGYLIRRFRAAHGLTPEQWRRAARTG